MTSFMMTAQSNESNDAVIEKIVKEALDLLNNEERFDAMSTLHNPYGDGNASERIVDYIAQLEAKKVKELK